MSKDEEVLEELRKIREAIEAQKPAPPPPAPKGLWNEFKDFLSKYKVLGLAVAFILGLYLGALVQALAKDLLLPAIGLAIPEVTNLASYTVNVFAVGDFLVALVTFLLVALVIFLFVKIASKWGME